MQKEHFKPRKICLTSGADFLLVDGADVDGEGRCLVAVAAPSPQGHGVVPAEEAPVILLSESPAVERAGVIAKPGKHQIAFKEIKTD